MVFRDFCQISALGSKHQRQKPESSECFSCSSVRKAFFCKFGLEVIFSFHPVISLLANLLTFSIFFRGASFECTPLCTKLSDLFFHLFSVNLTFCRTALSRDSTLICSFLRLAFSATLSELALARTWAISSLALLDKKRRRQ